MKTKKQWKKIVVLFVFLMFLCTACGKAEPVVKVITVSETDETAGPEYSIVYNNGKSKATDAFSADDAEFYTVSRESFTHDIVDNHIQNSIENLVVTDKDGNVAETDETVTAVIELTVEKMEHSITKLTVIQAKEECFVVVHLNVNLWSPCELYRYDSAAGDLEELEQWDNVDIIGIALP